jgi:DNA-binding NarL/FixJ family response regulator
MIRIAVLHPSLSVARDLQFQLRSAQEFQVVHISQERERLLEALQALNINAVVVSSELEGGDVFPICQEIHVYAPKVGTLIHTTAQRTKEAKRMLHRGAAGCVLNDDAPEVLHEALRNVGSGSTYISSSSAFYMLGLRQPLDRADQTYRPSLSKREKDVMRAILEERTTAEIADLLKISFGTVETHRRNMLAKVGARNTAGLVRSCYEMSLLE